MYDYEGRVLDYISADSRCGDMDDVIIIMYDYEGRVLDYISADSRYGDMVM